MDRLDELAVFVAVLDAGSLAGAARRLGRSPAAVTRVLAALEIGESSRDTVAACRSARRTFDALIALFAPLGVDVAAGLPAAPQAIAPALLRAFGAAPPPAPLDDDHIDLPVDDEPGEGDTVFDLPFDEPADGNADTQPLPL